jgi:hypothetical protein
MSKNRRRHKSITKPTGVIGPIVLDPSVRTAEFVPIKFPTEIERYILDRAIATVGKTGHSLYRLTATPIQNPESHFDFTLPTARGEQYLDLLEFAPLTGSYRGAPSSFYVWEFAEQLHKQVAKKASKYGYPRRERIHLLTYSTDWRFRPDLSVLSLLTLWFAHQALPFATVLYYSPDDQTSGEIWRLFPSRPEELQQIDEDALREVKVQLADFSEIQVNSSGAAMVPLSPPLQPKGG